MIDRDSKILIVDDIEAISVFTRMTLEKLNFEHIDLVSTIAEAEGVLASRHYDMVFLDVRMDDDNGAEDRSGLDLLETITKTYPHIKVVMATGEDSLEMEKEAIEKGAVEYLTKPVTGTKIVALLHHMKMESMNDRQ